MLERLLILWLSLLSGAAYLWPDVFGGGFDPFLATKPWLWYLIGVAMFAIGWLLPRDELRQVALRWPTVLGGTALQYLTMPLLAYGMARLLRLEGDLLVGVIVVGCVPGAMASNVLTLLSRGNVSYSLSLTTSATLLSPIVVPLALMWTLGRTVDFPAAQTSLELLEFVVLPVVAGHLCGRMLPQWEQVARRVGKVVANLVILWVIAVVVAASRDRLYTLDTTLLGALLGINFGGYAAGYWGAMAMRLTLPMRRALTLEIGMQNAGLGSTLALALFPDAPLTAVPSALYTFGSMFTATLLATAWARRPPASALEEIA